MGSIEDEIKESDGPIRGAVVGVQKTNSLIKQPVNLLYLYKYKDSSDFKSHCIKNEVFH